MSNSNSAYNVVMPAFLGADGAAEKLNFLVRNANLQQKDLQIMNKKLLEIVQEQDEYVFEIENYECELKFIQEDYERQMKSLENKYWTLKGKELDGNISDSELKELEDIESQMDILTTETNDASADLNSSIKNSKQKFSGTSNLYQTTLGILDDTSDTIDGLEKWNSDNSIENGGASICKMFIKASETIIDDLSNKYSTLNETVNKYNFQSSFIKR